MMERDLGWQLEFDTVHDAVGIHVGKHNGPFIVLLGRGAPGVYTWLYSDPMGETRDIGLYVGDGDRIQLRAFVKTLESTHSSQPLCIVKILYNGQERHTWEFSQASSCEISR
jgi:hypothetical protein